MRRSLATPLQGASNLQSGGSSIPVRRTSGIFSTSTAPKTVTRSLFPSAQTGTKDPPNERDPPTAIDSLRAENHALKYEISNLKDESERERLRFEKTIRELELRTIEEGKRADAIETDQQFIFEKHKQSSVELEKLKSEWPVEKAALEKTIRQLRQEVEDARDAQEEAESAMRAAQSTLNREKNDSSIKLMNLSTVVQELQSQLAKLNESLQERVLKQNEQHEALEKSLSENKMLKSRIEDLNQLDTVQRQLSEQIARAKALEDKLHIITPELTHLREEHKKLKFVAEEKTLLEARVKLMEDLRRQVADAEAEASALREQQARWTSFFDANDHFKSPEDVLRALSQERSEKIALIDSIGRLEAELAARNHSMQVDEHEIKKVEDELSDTKQALAKNEKLLARVERQKALALKETQFLRDQLKTYDSEETMYLQGNYDQQKASRIETLENILDQSKQEIARLTEELRRSEQSNKESNSKKHRLNDEDDERIGELLRRNRALQDEYTELKKKEESSRKEVSVLEKRLAALEQNRLAQSRILELRDNPVSKDQAVKREMLVALQTENNSLLAQLEGRHEDIGPTVSVATLDRLKLEIQEMKTEVLEKEKRMKRLKEIWSAKSMEFREAVYSLLGYKLDFLPNNKVRATSMFAASDEESFTFDPEAGTMKLSGRTDSPFAQECSNLITFWVQERREIPCFLAALNLELYDRTTKAARF